MRNDEAYGLAVRREEVVQRPFEVRVLEDFRRQVERVVIFGAVEGFAHRRRVIAQLVHLPEDPRHGAVHRQHHRPHGLHAGDHRRELRDHLRHQRIKFIEVFGENLELVVDLIDTINRLEYGSQRKTDRDVVAVFFPVEVAADRPPGVLEVCDVISQFFGDGLHFLRLTDHFVCGIGELLS